MERSFEAVYENGVLRPLEALSLPNNLHVTVTIAGPALSGKDLAGYFTSDEWEAAAHDPISLDEVRAALASIPGSLSDAVIESREDRQVSNFFLDTSALAKLYHREPGSDVMERILSQSGNRCLISRLSIVEMESVLAIKARSHQLDDAGIEVARRRLRADIAQRRIIVAPSVEEEHL